MPREKKPGSGIATDRRIVRTRGALMQAGYALFSERGLHDVSVEEIIDAARISKQTFYNHFTDKTALARAIYLSIRDEVEAEVRQVTEGVADPALRVARGICVYVRTALREPNHIRIIAGMLVHDIRAADPANRGLLRDLEAGLAAGRFVVRTIETAAAFVLGAAEPLLLSVVTHRNKPQAVVLTQEIITFTLRGLSVPSAEAELIASQAANLLIK